MKNKLLQFLCLGVFLGTAPIYAQHNLECDIPFDFNIGPTSMTAGRYLVTFPISGAVRLSNVETHRSAVVLTIGQMQPGQRIVERSRLVFTRYAGDQNFLSQVWSGGSDRGYVVRKTRAEIEVASSLKDRVTIASR